MDKDKIMEFIKSKDVEDLEEIKYKAEILVTRFYYDFSDDEIDAARAFADDEGDIDNDGESWWHEHFLPYLDDIAADNIGEIIEEGIDELEVKAQYIVYNVDKEEYDYAEAICVFYDKETDVDVDQVLDDLKL